MPSNKMIAKLVELAQGDDLVSKAAKLRFDAEKEAFIEEALKKESRDRALREAADFGKDRNSTVRMLSDQNLPDQTRAVLAELAGKEAMAKAISDDDISYIIDHARELNQQGRAALEELLLERGDVNKMYSLNKQLGNRYMETDVSDQNRILNDIKKRFGLSEAQSDVDSKFVREASMDPSAVGGEIYDVPVEMSGMSAVPRSAMRDDIREAMKINRLKENRQFLGDIDEILADPDVPLDLIANSSRYKAWKENMENSLKKRSEAQKNLDSRAREKNRISSGYGKTFDDIGDVHERANTAPLREVLDSDNVEYIFDQFEGLKDSAPRARDYGDETVYLNDVLSGKTKRKDDESLQKIRKMIKEAADRIPGEGRDVSVRKFTPSGKPAGYTNVREKQLLREMYPVTKKQNIDKDLGQTGMRISKWDKPATREFIRNVSRENGFRFSEQMIDRMLRMTKQQVVDFIEDVANPSK